MIHIEEMIVQRRNSVKECLCNLKEHKTYIENQLCNINSKIENAEEELKELDDYIKEHNIVFENKED